MNYIYDLLFFFIVYLIVFTVNYLMLLKKVKKRKKIDLYDYLIKRFRLNPKYLKKAKIILPISLINAFIIAFVTTIITMLDIKFIWQLMIGFVLIFALIYSLYELYGRHLVTKIENEKKEN